MIADCVVPAGNAPSLSKDREITMLTFPGGQERTEAQFQSLLKEIRFRTQVHHAHNNNDQCGGRKTSLSVAGDVWCAGYGAAGS
jgi:hypothetical protein